MPGLSPPLFLALGSLTVNRRVGIFHGRPISIASVDVDADLPSPMPKPTLSFRNPELLLTSIQLNQYLSKVAHIM